MQYLKYNEVRQRGTPEFPLEIYHITSCHPHYAMPYHWHMEYEVIRILEGKFTISLNEEEMLTRSGDLVLIPGGMLHAGQPEKCIYECIVFEPEMLFGKHSAAEVYFNRLQSPNLKVYNRIPADDPFFPPIIHRLFEQVWKKKDGYQLAAQGLLLQFFGTIFTEHYYQENAPAPVPNQKRIEQLKVVLSYIEKNYSGPVSLSGLSRAAGMSPKYFCRFFQEMTHRTPVGYLNSYRIDRAVHELATTGRSITEIAYSCGFNDLSYFIKTFRRYKGVTPKQYLLQKLGTSAL